MAENALTSWIRAIEAIKRADTPDASLPVLFDRLADTFGDRPALRDDSRELTYRDLAQRAAQYANWALAQHLAPGDVVCLLLPNCADYVAIWFGLTRIGCVAALINTNLVGDALAHCIAAAASRRIIVGASLAPALAGIMDRLPTGTACWTLGLDESPFPRLAPPSGIGPRSAAPAPRAHDTALLIYTSGTTGFPKAARVSHGRVVEWSVWFAAIMDAGPADRLYNCLPMYHSIGGVVAIGAMLVAGGSVLIRERFSASRFWDEVIDGNCTIFQYIGELCRYLARAAPHPRETKHQLRLCCGNGLRGDIWEAFQARFKMPRILEYYAATEGNVSLYNLEGRPGAIGRVPPFLAHRFPIALVCCDPDGEPLRDAAGLCRRAAVDEPGEAISPLGVEPARRFDGYTDAGASARKVLRDVFAAGDRWFRTGDLLRKDRAGYYYFVDRLGDTFRWKGENVSTTQVAAVVGACPGVADAVVFGVTIPGHEGRAGMAAITADDHFSLAALQNHLAANLPPCAQPLFLRLCASLEITGTFKLKKDVLQRHGFSMPCPDTIWFNDRDAGFIPCDESLLASLATMRL